MQNVQFDFWDRSPTSTIIFLLLLTKTNILKQIIWGHVKTIAFKALVCTSLHFAPESYSGRTGVCLTLSLTSDFTLKPELLVAS